MLQVPVPAVGFEEQYWIAENDGMQSRRQMAVASGPYRSTITPNITDIRLDIPSEVVASVPVARIEPRCGSLGVFFDNSKEYA